MEKYKIFTSKDMIIIAPEGEMTSRTYPEFEKEFMEDLNCFSKMKVVFNMEKIEFLDSAGIIFLLRIKNIVTSRNGYMAVYGLKKNIEKTMVKLRLDSVFNITGNAEQCFIDLWYLADEESQSPAAAVRQ